MMFVYGSSRLRQLRVHTMHIYTLLYILNFVVITSNSLQLIDNILAVLTARPFFVKSSGFQCKIEESSKHSFFSGIPKCKGLHFINTIIIIQSLMTYLAAKSTKLLSFFGSCSINICIIRSCHMTTFGANLPYSVTKKQTVIFL